MPEHVYFSSESTLSVPFFDVDTLEVAWHGHYVKYFEIARCDLLDQIGHNYNDMRQAGFAWPIVRLEIKYLRPARFGQKLTIRADVVEYESCLKVRYTIFDTLTHTVLTRGFTMQAAVRLDNGEMQLQTPAVWQQAIRSHARFSDN